MSDKYKELEGSVPVNGDITPITRRPIDQIDSSEWHTLPTGDLVDQRQSLVGRMSLVESMGRADLVPTMRRGIALIDAILKERGAFEETHLI